MGLEDEVYGSKAVRNYLSMFSEHYWGKVTKATLIVGICRLMDLTFRKHGGIKPLHQMSVEDLEELAVQAMTETQKRQRKAQRGDYQESDHKRFKRTEATNFDSHHHHIHSPSTRSPPSGAHHHQPKRSPERSSLKKKSNSPLKASFADTYQTGFIDTHGDTIQDQTI